MLWIKSGVVARTCNLSTGKAEAENHCEFEASLDGLSNFQASQGHIGRFSNLPQSKQQQNTKFFLRKFLCFELRFHYGAWLGTSNAPVSAVGAGIYRQVNLALEYLNMRLRSLKSSAQL